MSFSSIFALATNPRKLRISSDSFGPQPPSASDSLGNLPSQAVQSEPPRAHPNQSEAIQAKTAFLQPAWFLPTHSLWLNDDWHLRIWEKSRQVGATKTDAFKRHFRITYSLALPRLGPETIQAFIRPFYGGLTWSGGGDYAGRTMSWPVCIQYPGAVCHVLAR